MINVLQLSPHNKACHYVSLLSPDYNYTPMTINKAVDTQINSMRAGLKAQNDRKA